MQFIDTHCHIQSAGLTKGERSTRELWAKAPELSTDTLVADAIAAEVTKMICVGCDVEDSRLAIECAAGHTECYASIGIHPHEAARHKQDLAEFATLASQPKVVAIGECGLDYFYEHSPRDDQMLVLKFQLELAQKTGLPVIFHVREAFEDFWPIFDSFPAGTIKGVLHSFTDSKQNLDKAVARGLFIGVNGIATFAKQQEQLQMYAAIPLEHIVLETDAPFLTPVPFRGTINKPQQITTVAAYLATLRNEPLEAIAKATTDNASRLFDI